MDLPTDVTGIAVALAAGLLVGAERERRKGEGPARAAAGIRTFAVVGLLGGLAALVGGAAVIAVALGFVALAALAGYLASREDDPGLTTESAMVATFLLGALAIKEPALAAGLAVAMTVLLATRTALHRFVRSIVTEDELHDLLILAAAAVVVLPLLPNKEIGPYAVINPFEIWRLVVLVMGIGGVGHVATRVLGARFGLPIAGLSGGFISSVATIASMGEQARGAPRAVARAAVAGAVLSSVATIAQMTVVLASVSQDVLRTLAIPLAAGGAAALAYGSIVAGRIPRSVGAEPAVSRRAFSLKDAGLFAATVTGVLFVSAAANDWLGDSGLYVSTALAGLAESHAAGASAASLAARGEVSAESAAIAVLLGLSTNSLTKLGAAFFTGGRIFLLAVGGGVLLVLAALWLPAPAI